MKKISLSLLLVFASVQAFCAESFSIAVSEHNFDFLNKGFAETILAVAGLPVGADVEWSIISVQNNSTAMASGWENRISGLSWGEPISGNIEPAGLTTGSEVVLTDIIGERSVHVRATAKLNGKTLIAEKVIIFGKGPLTVFNTPHKQRFSWLETYKICNGVEYTGDPSDWEIGIGFVGGGKMPSMAQLQAVAMPTDKNPIPYAMGAAVAAGWQMGWYWNGRAVMQGRASHVNLANGTVHGSGGRDVRDIEYGVCVK